METQEKSLSHTESLAIIQNMIATAKNSITDDGFHFMLWGVLVIAASLAQYLLAVVFDYAHNDLPWMIMPAIGIPAAFIYEWRKKKHEQVRTHFDAIFGLLWGGIGVSIFCTIFISVKSGLSPIAFILILAGVGTFVSGCILKFKPLTWGGPLFWVAAIAASFVSPVNQLLVNSVAIFLGYIIPGILLWRNYKTENHV